MMIIYDSMNTVMPEGGTCIALGLFDGLHRGHMPVIMAAVNKAKESNKQSCVFTFTVKGTLPQFKTPGLLQTSGTFLGLLEEFGVDIVIRPDFSEFSGIPPEDFCEILTGRFGASFISAGEDFRFGYAAKGNMTMLSSLCRAEICVIPSVKDGGAVISSSVIRAYIKDGDIKSANNLLDRRFSIDFTVIHGRALGRTLGAPTINQPFPEGFIVPKFGVYATMSTVDGLSYPSVTNVGVKPTVGSDLTLAETYIHGFDGLLYGESVKVEFLDFIRPERRFDSIEELRAQIIADSAKAAKIAETLKQQVL